MNFHIEPRQCLANLKQEEVDGGRGEFLENERRRRHVEPEMPTGDCAVVSLVHATFRLPTGQSYREAKWDLQMSTESWMYDIRRKNEDWLPYAIRRIRQWFSPPRHDPIHGTPSHATANRLMLRGYDHIYPNKHGNWHCICDTSCTYVLDVQLPGGDHTLTVHRQVAYTTAPFHPDQTEVGNVHRLGARKTEELKDRKRQKEAELQSVQEWLASGGLQLPDWMNDFNSR